MIALLAVAGIAGVARPIAGQGASLGSLVLLGSDLEERVRAAQLTGERDASGYLLRSASRLNRFTASNGFRAELFVPDVYLAANSDHPFSMNDGGLWAGRGTNLRVTAGLQFSRGPARLVVAPSLLSEANDPFQVIPYPQAGANPRSVWANPFHPLPESIDLPLRFGDGRRRRLDPGQSSVTLTARNIAFGVATENRWWGPGNRNAIVLSSNAAGFPHWFIQTAEPVATRAGVIDAQLIAGRLSESDYFDADETNDDRTISGLAVTWSRHRDRGLFVGVARLVIAAAEPGPALSAPSLRVFKSVGRPNTDTSATKAADQVTSVFGRWLFPGAGFEAYFEWARFEEPASLRDLIEYPNHSQGYTLGLQWVRALAEARTVRFQTEVTYLEPSPSLRLRPVATSYTSRTVPQGFTNRGEALGAAIGPGASSQWVAADYSAGRWTGGLFAGRIRWDNATLFRDVVPEVRRPDISLFAGIRASLAYRGGRASLAYTRTARLNYLFQTYLDDPVQGVTSGVDLRNHTLVLTLTGSDRK